MPHRPPIALVAALLATLVTASLTSCRAFPAAPRTDPDDATVVSTRTESHGPPRGDRVVATVEDHDGRRWDVRLLPTTHCVVGATYPRCADADR